MALRPRNQVRNQLEHSLILIRDFFFKSHFYASCNQRSRTFMGSEGWKTELQGPFAVGTDPFSGLCPPFSFPFSSDES